MRPRTEKLLMRLVFIAAIPGVLALGYFWYGNRRIADLKDECQTALNDQRWEDLERASLSWYEWQPESAQPLLLAAQAAQQRGRLLEASVYLFQLPDNDLESIPGLMNLSTIQLELLDPLAAETTWNRILQLDPANAEAHQQLILYYGMSRQHEKIISEARRAIAAGSDGPSTYVFLFGADWMTFTNGGDLNNAWLERFPGNETFLVARGFHFTRSMAMREEFQQRNENGVNVLEATMIELVKQFNHNKELLAYHLELSTNRGDMENTLTLLGQAGQDSLEDSRFWRFKGWVHLQREELDEAIEAYQHCLKLHPFDGVAHQQLAMVYRRQEKLDQVAHHQQLSVVAQDILRIALVMPNVNETPPDLLEKMAEFAELAGENQVAENVKRLKNAESPSGE
ncbi:MAG: hypothetical protein KDB14_18820 [Planctomycetales bacterium]|nr:hypothetical protein [Planctomycetales bacterium]